MWQSRLEGIEFESGQPTALTSNDTLGIVLSGDVCNRGGAVLGAVEGVLGGGLADEKA